MARWIKIIGVNLAVLLVAALVVELIFGSWLSHDPLDGLDIHRNLTVRLDASKLYPGGKPFLFHRNHWGFRGADVDPATIDVVTFGGSTTNQMYLPEELTWQAVMTRRLAELGHPMVVANAGLEGQSTVGMLTDLTAWFPNVPGLHPKIILGYVGINDALRVGNVTDTLSFSSIHKKIHQYSALSHMWRTIRGTLLARSVRVTHHAEDYAHATWTDTPKAVVLGQPYPGFDAVGYEARLHEMAARIRALGAEPIFVTQRRGDSRLVDGKMVGLVSDGERNGLDDWLLLSQLNDVARKVCTDEHMRCLDLARDLPLGDGDFYDLLHNSPQGGEKIGRWLAEQLVATAAK